MYLAEAVDAIREKLVQHRLPGRKTLWATILKQIAKQDNGAITGDHRPGLGRGQGCTEEVAIPSPLRRRFVAGETRRSPKVGPCFSRPSTAFADERA
jgi:hypothetical protein